MPRPNNHVRPRPRGSRRWLGGCGGVPTLGDPGVLSVRIRVEDLDPRVASALAGQMTRHVPGGQSGDTAGREHDVRVVLADPESTGQGLGSRRADAGDAPPVVESPVDPRAERGDLEATRPGRQLGQGLVRYGQAGVPEIPSIDNGVVGRSSPVGVGLDVEHELEGVIDAGHGDVDGDGPAARDTRARVRWRAAGSARSTHRWAGSARTGGHRR